MNSAQDALASIRHDYPDATLVENITYRQLSGHAAVSFAVLFPQRSLVQKLVLVVSEAHQRFWLSVLSVDATEFPFENSIFERMLASFTITLAPLILGMPATQFFVIVAGVSGAAGALVVFLVLRKRSRGRKIMQSRETWPPAFPPSVGSADLGVPRFCVNCGTPTAPQSLFCGTCGVAITRSLSNRPMGPQ